MAYCYNCGNQIELKDLFCSSCGAKQELACNNKSKENDSVKGIILIDTSKIAGKLNVSGEKVKSVIEQYKQSLNSLGIDYSVVDCSSYKVLNNKASVFSKYIKLNPQKDSWLKYSQLLTDSYCFAYGDDKPIFLFIIGGDDIIPMPKVDNKCYIKGKNNDKDIDCDLLYSYMLDEDTISYINSSEIFKYTPYFYIGRLPIGDDTSFETFSNYFERTSNVICEGGLQINSAYGQIDRNWIVESSVVSSSIAQHNLLLPQYETLPQEFSAHRLVLTPNLLVSDIDEVLNVDAELLYFNMHGSNVPTAESAGYFGESYCGVTPREMHKMNNLNICITEACYGARFIGLNSSQSMLLSAINNNAIAFLGSSRIAWGSGVYNYENVERITNADIICKTFLDVALAGYPLGVALQLAKQNLVERAISLSLTNESSLLEFNLFGDPVISIYPKGSTKVNKHKENLSNLKPIANDSTNISEELKIVYEAEQERSILNIVRNRVDSNFKEIHNKIKKNLYDIYNLEPRRLELAQKVTYKDKSEEYILYHSDNNSEHTIIAVISDVDGNIKNVVSSK